MAFSFDLGNIAQTIKTFKNARRYYENQSAY